MVCRQPLGFLSYLEQLLLNNDLWSWVFFGLYVVNEVEIGSRVIRGH